MERRPNFLLINCDDMGYGDLGCYGSQINRSPHVDDQIGRATCRERVFCWV